MTASRGRSADLVMTNIGQLLAMAGDGARFAVSADAAVWVADGRVRYAGPERRLPPEADGAVVDAGRRLVTPGLVDAHTHLLYAGQRAQEVALRARGAGYLEMLQAGGGILATVSATAAASDDDVLAATRARLGEALRTGTTTLELKTGYGLTPAAELRLMRLAETLRAEGPQRLVLTFLGAHALPPSHRGDPARFLGEMAATHAALVGRADFVDIFLEPGVFDAAAAEPYLAAAQQRGLAIKVHVDELQDGGGAAVAARCGAVSADHCAYTSPEGIAALKAAGTVAVLLPGTAGYLHPEHMAPARQFLDAGVPIAIASDGNPGSSPTSCLGTLLPWAAAWLHLTPEEVWAAVTRGGAAALSRADVGRLTAGSWGDLVVWDTDDYRVPCYRYGANLVRGVYVGGQPVVPERAEPDPPARPGATAHH